MECYVEVKQDEFFPADLMFLVSPNPDGVCYIEICLSLYYTPLFDANEIINKIEEAAKPLDFDVHKDYKVVSLLDFFEKTATPNIPLRGFEVIDDAKKQIEAVCPGVVSCADVLALAARDSVVLTKGISWSVPTGRRDGVVSLASDTSILPGLRDSVAAQKALFKSKGLNTQDLVALVGGHTIGTAGCIVFNFRLQNFNTTTGGPDNTINPAFLAKLQALCPPTGDALRRVPLDDGSEGKFDTSFFNNLRAGKGVLLTDQLLWGDASTRSIVQRFISTRGLFDSQFAKSMVKMSNIGVKTGKAGQIRKVCTAIN